MNDNNTNGFEDVVRVWRQQDLDAAPWDPREVLMQVDKKSRAFRRRLFWRDLTEVVAGVFAVAVMGAVSWAAPGSIPKLGHAAATGLVAYTLYRLLRVRRGMREARSDVSLVERLRAEIRRVDTQRELLGSVRSWYIVPLALAGTVWMAGLVAAMPFPASAKLVAVPLAIGFCASLFAAVGFAVERLNRHAIDSGLDPYRDDLTRMLRRAENA